MKNLLILLSATFFFFLSCKDKNLEEKEMKKNIVSIHLPVSNTDTALDDYSILKKNILKVYLQKEKEAFMEYHKNTQQSYLEYDLKIKKEAMRIWKLDFMDVFFEDYEIKDGPEAVEFFYFKESQHEKHEKAKRSFYKKYQKINKDALKEYQNKKKLLDKAQERFVKKNNKPE